VAPASPAPPAALQRALEPAGHAHPLALTRARCCVQVRLTNVCMPLRLVLEWLPYDPSGNAPGGIDPIPILSRFADAQDFKRAFLQFAGWPNINRLCAPRPLAQSAFRRPAARRLPHHHTVASKNHNGPRNECVQHTAWQVA